MMMHPSESRRTGLSVRLDILPIRLRRRTNFLRSSQLNNTSCVIADVHMPGMSGIELQNLLQTQGHRLPIIFITAFPEESVRAQALEAGAACFLSKPFDAQILIKNLDAAVKGHGCQTGK